jgi:hypothetical protein
LPWLWWLHHEFGQRGSNHSVFAKNYEHVLAAEAARLFFAEVDARARSHGWTGDEHFRAEGARVESWASLKSVVRQDGRKAQKL